VEINRNYMAWLLDEVNMKISSKLLLVLSLVLASNSYATITCSKPKLSKPVGRNAMYHFKAVVTCDIVGETINIPAIKDAYLADITKPNSQFKVRKQGDYDNKKGMTGYALDVTQSYDSSKGYRVVKADILLLDDKNSNFYMELRSRSVAGQGDAQYNKSILNTVTLHHTTDKDTVTVVKEIDVEEPWYAPHDTFVNAVQTELTASIRETAPIQAKKIIGEKVDAMHK
jgi:hypothetical protein